MSITGSKFPTTKHNANFEKDYINIDSEYYLKDDRKIESAFEMRLKRNSVKDLINKKKNERPALIARSVQIE